MNSQPTIYYMTRKNRGIRVVLKAFLTLALILVHTFRLSATESQVVNFLKLSEITAGSTLKATDPKYIEEEENPSEYLSVRTTKVRLVYDGSDYDFISSSGYWSCKVFYSLGGEEDTLRITGGSTQTTQNYISEYVSNENLAETSITITKIDTTDELPAGIRLELEIDCERYQALDVSESTDYGDITLNQNTNEISWTYIPGAEAYDVEWVFIDAKLKESSQPSTIIKAFALKEPVSIRVKGNYHTIDNFYPDGTLYFRFRPIGYDLDDTESQIAGHWEYGSSSYDISGTQNDYLWQYVATYAEEGKHKSVVSYYDGSMRQRQSLTYLTSENQTLIGETKYDKEGRAALSVMPAPIDGKELGYQPEFNKNSSGSEYTYADFDKEEVEAMLTTSGAAQYYSENNDLSTEHAAYIPEAEGRPFSVTRYMHDNTGRVSQSSGVGETLGDGGGHETQYFYGTPTSTELYRLFGSNVGTAGHYKKNMVVDPNGQISVSYLDPQGRVIATALAGDAPDNLDALSSQGNNDITVNLDGSNTIDKDALTSKSVNSVTHTSPEKTYTFTYDMAANTSSTAVAYDLEVSISDPEGNSVAITYNGTTSNTLEIVNATSLSSVTFTADFDETGTYTITKELTLNPDVAEDALEEYIKTYTTETLTEDDYVSEYLEENPVDESDCDCDGSTDESYDEDSVINAAYESSCDIYLSDVSPGGFQYEEPLDSANAFWSRVQSLLDEGEIAAYYTDGTALSDTSEFVDSTWQDAWAEQLVLAHREYCHYEICVSSITTNIYDNTLSDLSGWTAAQSAPYYINPLNMTATLDGDTLPECTDIDTFLYLDDGMYAADIEDSMLNYFIDTNDNDKVYNLWDYIEAFYDGDFYDTSSADYESAILTVDTLTASEKNSYKWQMFCNVYSALKEKVMVDQKGCEYLDATDDIYVRAYESVGEILSIETEEDYEEYSEEALLNYETGCAEACSVNVRSWMMEMAERCGYDWDELTDNTIYNKVFTILQNYCANNCDVDNPLGLLKGDDLEESLDLEMPECLACQDCETLADERAGEWMTKLANYYGFDWDDYTTEQSNTYDALYEHFESVCNAGSCYDEFTQDDYNSINIDIPDDYAASEDCLFEDDPYEYEEVIYVEDNGVQGAFIDLIVSLYNAYYNNKPSGSFYIVDSADYYKYCYSTSSKVLDTLDLMQTFRNTYNCEEGLYALHFSSSGSISAETRYMEAIASGPCIFISYLAEHENVDYIKVVDYAYDYYYGDELCIEYAIVDVYYKDGSKGISKITCDENYFLDVTTRNCSSCATEAKYNFSYPTSSTCPSTTSSSIFDFEDSDLSEEEQLAALIEEEEASCLSQRTAEATSSAISSYTTLVEEQKETYYKTIEAEAFNADFTEDFQCTYDNSEYHYTLYYYDQAGNLVQTVPPEGVNVLETSSWSKGIYDGTTNPEHTQVTTYKYNSLNQVVEQETPDAGVTQFWYNSAGQLRYSQNAKQASEGSFSYTKYDNLGRIVEVGKSTQDLDDCIDYIDNQTDSESQYPTSGTSEVTHTYYDAQSVLSSSIMEQENLRNRVASVTIDEDPSEGTYDHATHYSYDVHGNVKELVQEYPILDDLNRYKTIEYEYDLVSGNVNKVIYQRGYTDQFMHKYQYDADNRITKVYTSRYGNEWYNEARYDYYAHGPLARTELGQYKVQGIDYAYTLQGWLKGVNSDILEPVNDIGKDGYSSDDNLHKGIARDAFGYSLGYYDGDYSAVGGQSAAENFLAADANSSSGARSLYNGNISHMVTNNADATVSGFDLLPPELNAYTYDQLNRITSMQSFTSSTLTSTNDWSGASSSNSMNSSYSYDANGNLQTLTRTALTTSGTIAAMDDLEYQYNTEEDKINQLVHVNDDISDDVFSTDIDDMGTYSSSNTSSWNYGYDEIGNLVKDVANEIPEGGIEWTTYGKIKSITHTSGSTYDDLIFTYDGAGNRISKLKVSSTEESNEMTYYVRDASGNIMAIYTAAFDKETDAFQSITCENFSIFGSSRLGMYNESIAIASQTTTGNDSITTGMRQYELSNHLGNVLNTISDNKYPVDEDEDGTVDYYRPDVETHSRYFPFGMQAPEFTMNADDYRFGFNGKEMDNEVAGTGNQYDYGFRIYNPRLGRFLSIDPLASKYPHWTPYQYASNTPIWAIDLDGLEAVISTKWTVKQGDTFWQIENDQSIPHGTMQNLNPDVNPTVLQPGQILKTAYGMDGVYGGKMIVYPDDYNVGEGGGSLPQEQTIGVYNPKLSDFCARSAYGFGMFFTGMFMNAANSVANQFWSGSLTYVDATIIPPNRSSAVKVDLMGGKVSSNRGFINYDKYAEEGIADDVMNFNKYFPARTVDEMVVNNPQSEFLSHVSNSMKSGGTLTVRGTMSNKYFNKIYNGKADGLEGYKIIKTTDDVPNNNYLRTDGQPIKGQINEVVLQKL